MKTNHDIQSLEKRYFTRLTLPHAPTSEKPDSKVWKTTSERIQPSEGSPVVGKKQKENHGTGTRLSIQSP
jgi:hypothetical protein